MSGRREHVAAPGVAATSAALAPPVREHDSKRDPAVIETEVGMVGSMQEMRIDTVVKNREFEHKLEVLRARVARVNERREEEAAARDQHLQAVREEIEARLRSLGEELSESIDATFAALDEKRAKVPVDAEAVVAREQEFYKETIPARNEEMVGPLVHRMLREHQAFALDKTKVRARERALVERFEAWYAGTKQRCVAETTDRDNVTSGLDCGVVEMASRHDREAEAVQVRFARQLLDVRGAVEDEAGARARADADTLAEATVVMERLQTVVLANFGMEDDDDSYDEEEDEVDADDEAPAGGDGKDED